MSSHERKKFGSLAEKKQRLHIFLIDTAKKSSFESVQTALFIYTSIMTVIVNLSYLQVRSMLSPWVKVLAPQHAVSFCKSVASPARWAANEKVLPSLHAGPTLSFYYWDLIFCV